MFCFIPVCFTLVPLPSCQPRLAQHHRLLLSIPSVFSVLLLFFRIFFRSPTNTARCTTHPTICLYSSLFFSSTGKHFVSCFNRRAASEGEKHPSTTTRRQGANTATPILTPALSLRSQRRRFAALFYVCVCTITRAFLTCSLHSRPPSTAPLAPLSSCKYHQGLGC